MPNLIQPAGWRTMLGMALAVFLLWGGRGAVQPPRTAAADFRVCLNEIFPRPCALGIGDFVELYNRGDGSVDLTGWTLRASPGQVRDLSGLSIAARGYLVIQLSLPNDVTVSLFDAQGAKADEQTYQGAKCDLAMGRYPDGANSWQRDLPPSPGGANQRATATPTPSRTVSPTFTPGALFTASATVTPTATRTPTAGATTSPTPQPQASATVIALASPQGRVCISEFLPAPRNVDWDGNGTADYTDEWIELHNHSAEDVALDGWMLDDRAGGGSAPFVFTTGTVLRAGAYAVYYQRQTRLELNNNGDDVRFLSPDGEEVEKVSYQTTRADASYSRTGGCTGVWTMQLAPSPGRANSAPCYVPLIYGLRS